jgi:hypothetical protein
LHNHRATATKKESIVGRLSGQDKFTPLFQRFLVGDYASNFRNNNPFDTLPPRVGEGRCISFSSRLFKRLSSDHRYLQEISCGRRW